MSYWNLMQYGPFPERWQPHKAQHRAFIHHEKKPLQFLLKVHAHSGNTTLNSLKHRVRMLKAVRFSFAMIKYLIRPFASHAPEYYTDHHLWQNDWQKVTQLRWNQLLWTLQDFNKAASYFILCHFNNTMIISVPLPEPGSLLFRCHVFRLERLRRLGDVIKSSRW